MKQELDGCDQKQEEEQDEVFYTYVEGKQVALETEAMQAKEKFQTPLKSKGEVPVLDVPRVTQTARASIAYLFDEFD